MKKGSIIALVIIAVAAGYYFGMGNVAPETAEAPETEQATTSSETVQTSATGDVYAFSGMHWIFEQRQEADEMNGMPPKTMVRVQFDGFTKNGRPIEVASWRLGEYHGTCSQVDPPAENKDAILFAQCWWAGIGNQFGMFKNGDVVVGKVRTIAEEDTGLEPMRDLIRIDLTTIVK